MNLRKFIFWLHLASGLGGGVIIAVMSLTGILVAFEAEMVAWLDRDVRRIEKGSDPEAERLTIDEVIERVRQAVPHPGPTALEWSNEDDRAWLVAFGRERKRYVDPYTGDLSEPDSTLVEEWMDSMIAWHRWLGMSGEGRAVGRAITGACNLAFLFLVVSGLYLWMPRRWSWKALRPLLWFVGRYRGRVRDWNWHNVVGFWCAPVLLVLVASGVVISYPWAGNLVYRLAGDEPPPPRRGPPRGAAAIEVPKPEEGSVLLTLEAQSAAVREAFPDWATLTLRLDMDESEETSRATAFSVKTHDQWPVFTSTTVQVDPYSGRIVRQEGFDDYSPGRRARSWLRFLHTGEAFGLPGKVIASAASAGALVLVWTGFALAWRRLFKPNRR